MVKRFIDADGYRRLMIVVAAFATVAVMAALTGAIAAGQTPTPNDAPKTGKVQGTVVSRKTGQPVAGATVRLSGGPVDRAALQKLLDFFGTRGVNVSLPKGEPDDAYYQSVIDAAAGKGVSLMNPEVQNAIATFERAQQGRFVSVTDSQGKFLITNVTPGSFQVVTESRDHFGPGSANFPAVPTDVRAGFDSIVNLSLTPGAAVAGHVSNTSGRPLSNMVVQAFTVAYQDGFPVLVPAANATTDDQGGYKLFWLPPGEYFVATTLPRGRRPPPVDGKDPVRTFYPRTTDVLLAQTIALRGGEELAGFDIEMQSAASFKVSGEIISMVPPPNVPAPVGANVAPTTATINLMARDPSVPDNAASRNLGTVQLAPSGDNKWSAKFEVQGIQPGLYDLSTWVRESNPDGGSSITIGRTPIEIRDQDLSGVQLNIYPSVRILGKVTLDGHAPGDITARISLQPEGSAVKVPVYQGIAMRAVVARPEDGSFMAPAVTFGQFRVHVQGLSPDVYVADVLQTGGSIYDSGFAVAGQTPDLIEVVLRSGSSTVEGVVKDGAGKTMANATVVLIPPVSRRSNRSLYKSVTTDPEGRFSIRGVAPENYQLYAWQDAPSGAFFNERFLAKFRDRGRAVYVSQKSTVTAELTAIPGETR